MASPISRTRSRCKCFHLRTMRDGGIVKLLLQITCDKGMLSNSDQGLLSSPSGMRSGVNNCPVSIRNYIK